MRVSYLMEPIRERENIHIINNSMMGNGRMDVKMDMELKSKRTSTSIQVNLKTIKEVVKEFYILLHKK